VHSRNLSKGAEVKIKRLALFGPLVLVAGALLPLSVAGSVAADDGAQHVRWDIISLVGGSPPGPINAGGMASATAPNGGDTITLTGSGTFVAHQGSDGGSRAVTGGGTWKTSTGSGTYQVKKLVTFEFANSQSSTPLLIDNIGVTSERANGSTVLKIEFSDGQSGVLTVGCHGPGAPPGIFEGIATTKGFSTYYNVHDPVAGVDANRTIFHVHQKHTDD
jgi:hypothetical protein